MTEWVRRNIAGISGILALIAWFALLYFMFWDVL